MHAGGEPHYASIGTRPVSPRSCSAKRFALEPFELGIVGTMVPHRALVPQHRHEIGAGMRALVARDLFGRARRDDGAAAIAALGAEIDEIVGRLDHVEIVLDHENGVAEFTRRSSTSSSL